MAKKRRGSRPRKVQVVVSSGSITRIASERELANFKKDDSSTYDNAFMLRFYEEDLAYCHKLSELNDASMESIAELAKLDNSKPDDEFYFTSKDIDTIKLAHKVLEANKIYFNAVKENVINILPF
jgi:hypothetical protein